MEAFRRHARNPRRMDSDGSGSICRQDKNVEYGCLDWIHFTCDGWYAVAVCHIVEDATGHHNVAHLLRHFINGSCRFGPRCNYRHEWPAAPSTQICRYFQKGGCWYGNSCRYLHVLQPDVDAAAAGRRRSVPTVSSSSVAYAPPDRRGSEPTLLQADVMSRQEHRSTSRLVLTDLHTERNSGCLASHIAEERIRDTNSYLTDSLVSVQTSEVTQARTFEGQNAQETSSRETTEEAGAAAASTTRGTEKDKDAFLQSEDVTCGICMEKVYEKTDRRNHVFGILPNCNHSFCLQCIMTWRKTKDLGPDVVKTCPQCRVRSAFYVPNRDWVEGQAKEALIAAFKEKCSKRSCSYYARLRWCPFKTECLYRHDKHANRRSSSYPAEDEDDYDGVDLVDLLIAMTFLSGGDDDDDDDFDFPFYLSEEYGF